MLQIAFTVGLIVLFGFVIGACNKQFYANFGRYGRTVCYVTGAIGTPIHELGHALFCLLFGHKINEIKLYQINAADGTLGYVNHSYNKRNLYQRIGNFFIGVGPILLISAVLFLLAYLLLPDFVAEISQSIQITDITSGAGDVVLGVLGALETFFLSALSWQFWVFLAVGMFLSLHMTLSKPDIQGAIGGLVFLLVTVLVVDVILAVVNIDALNGFTDVVLHIGSYLLCFLTLSLIISLLALFVSFIFRAVKR